eukprot:TRINITY_DN8982_c0_g2_i1.p1 TRINITY_DN8982_c0_g2~~TRINITY_DN8982_c0_g2_i1.p1  ORF type:complete len:200 (-),score=46.42 TRINITY_DN8982_c0_g2_i1:7-573(-)
MSSLWSWAEITWASAGASAFVGSCICAIAIIRHLQQLRSISGYPFSSMLSRNVSQVPEGESSVNSPDNPIHIMDLAFHPHFVCKAVLFPDGSPAVAIMVESDRENSYDGSRTTTTGVAAVSYASSTEVKLAILKEDLIRLKKSLEEGEREESLVCSEGRKGAASDNDEDGECECQSLPADVYYKNGGL